MEIGNRDFQIIVSTTVFIVIVSFVFPVLGFGGPAVAAADIPEFNASQGQFSYLEETPEYPSRPSEGTLTNIDGAEQYEDNRQVWLTGDSSDGISITLVNFNGTDSPEPQVNLNKFNSSGSFNTQSRINQSEYVLLENYSYIVSFESLNISDNGSKLSVDWELQQQPADTSWLGRIPVIGGVAGSAAQTAAVVGWLGTVIFHPIYNMMVTITNVFVSLANVVGFLFNLFYWLLTTYGAVVSAAPANWLKLILSIPGLALSFEFLKMLIVGIKTILDGVPLT